MGAIVPRMQYSRGRCYSLALFLLFTPGRTGVSVPGVIPLAPYPSSWSTSTVGNDERICLWGPGERELPGIRFGLGEPVQQSVRTVFAWDRIVGRRTANPVFLVMVDVPPTGSACAQESKEGQDAQCGQQYGEPPQPKAVVQ